MSIPRCIPQCPCPLFSSDFSCPYVGLLSPNMFLWRLLCPSVFLHMILVSFMSLCVYHLRGVVVLRCVLLQVVSINVPVSAFLGDCCNSVCPFQYCDLSLLCLHCVIVKTWCHCEDCVLCISLQRVMSFDVSRGLYLRCPLNMFMPSSDCRTKCLTDRQIVCVTVTNSLEGGRKEKRVNWWRI